MTVVTEDFISPRVQNLQPYQPGEQPKVDGLVKLNTNENPYPPSARVVERIAEVAATSLKLYPDPESDQLCDTIAAYYGVTREQVFVGNGSDEVLAHAFCAFFQHDNAKLLIPDVTYSFYSVYCRLFGIEPELVPVSESLRIDLSAFTAAANTNEPIAGIVVSNPNAPTGESLSLDAIEYLLSLHPTRVVLVDEAYVDFGGQSAMSLVQQYPNLLIVQTLSKSRALAGLRVGLAIGQPALIRALNQVKNSFNSFPLGCLAQQGAIAAFEDRAYFEQTCLAVMVTRVVLADGLKQLGFEVLPSSANFLFVRHPQHSAVMLAARLREARILVRHFKQERVAQYLRISIGTDQQVNYLLKVLEHVLNALEA
ncbi:histidinol-phosphate transaminase [Paenalcaligenes sp. Me131]|uniref:histidinol-phosphate transaminase n=1 Tax=Paenalcaligenes sp. Me131 TaxID=3392636 RepID=UPI003D2D8DD5